MKTGPKGPFRQTLSHFEESCDDPNPRVYDKTISSVVFYVGPHIYPYKDDAQILKDD